MIKRIDANNRREIKNINLHDKIMNIIIYDKLKKHIKVTFNNRLKKDNKQVLIEFFGVVSIIVNDRNHLYEPIGGPCEVAGLELLEKDKDTSNEIITIKIVFFIGSEIIIKFKYLKYE